MAGAGVTRNEPDNLVLIARNGGAGLADICGLKDREEAASDLRTGRLSAPVVHFLAAASEDERSRFLRFRGSGGCCAKAGYWLQRLRGSPAIEATINHARAPSRRGRTGLAELPPALAAGAGT